MLENSYLTILNVLTGGTFDASGNTIMDSIEESDMIPSNIKFDKIRNYININNQITTFTEITVYCNLKQLLKLQPDLSLINQIYIYDKLKSNKKKYIVYRYDVQTLTNTIKMILEEKK